MGTKNYLIDLTGKTFGRWRVIRRSGFKPWGDITWRCKCQCGVVRDITGGTLKNGKSRSCGCLKVAKKTKHGHSITRNYKRWCAMIARCHDPRHKQFRNYGGRGIHVCDRWRESFQNFFEDMGHCPDGMSLDRIDNDRGYSPENCRWASSKQQCRNTRHNRQITHHGETLTLTEWAERLGTNCGVLNGRLRRGWTMVDTITIPIGRRTRWTK